MRSVKDVYSEVSISSQQIYIQQEYGHIDEFLLVGGKPGSPFFGVSDHHNYRASQPDQPTITRLNINSDFSPDQVVAPH